MHILFFVHIPKNAGTTLNKIISHNFQRVCRISWNKEDENFYGKLIDSDISSKLIGCDVIRGHFPYGIHKHFKKIPEFTYLTMLRDPIKRTISAFNYLKYDSTYVGKHLELKEFLDNLSIREFVSEFHSKIPNHVYVDNAQVRYLSGIGDSKSFGTIDNSDLELAKMNLKSMIFGLSEEFNRSMLYFKKELSLKSVLYSKRKVGSIAVDTISDFDRDEILKVNKLDIQLYQYGKHLFEQRSEFITDKMLEKYNSQLKFYKVYDDLINSIVRAVNIILPRK